LGPQRFSWAHRDSLAPTEILLGPQRFSWANRDSLGPTVILLGPQRFSWAHRDALGPTEILLGPQRFSWAHSDSLGPTEIRTIIPHLSSPWGSHYTDWAIPVTKVAITTSQEQYVTSIMTTTRNTLQAADTKLMKQSVL